MTAEEIFAKIDAHMIEGVMLHDQMAAYFDFLNLRGYKREHECRAFDEFLSHRKIVRYYINHYNKLLPETHAENPSVVPPWWIAYERITLADISYDLPTIIMKQDEMHDEYREREEKMGVKID